MRIGVLGTGTVGRVISGKLAELGHDVRMGTRDVARTLAVTTPDMMGNPPFAEWQKSHPRVTLVNFAEAAAHAEMLVNATSGTAVLEILAALAPSVRDGKILVDIANPLDFSRGMPPTLTLCNTDSLGEQIQRAFPQVQVVKTLNTVNAYVMVNPSLVASGDHTMFISGDDAAAKVQVTSLLKEGFGWQHIIDLGDISTARGMEMFMPLWVRLFGALGTPMFNVKVVQ